MSRDLSDAVLGPVEVALFENLYAAYHLDALRVATDLLGDADQAADAVHTAFLEMLRYVVSGRRWHDPGYAKAAVLRNTRWAALNLARSRRRRAEMANRNAGVVEVGDDWARSEVRALCELIVGQLRPRQQTALRLHFAESLSYAEAGARMGISAKAFERVLARSLAAARRAAHSAGALPIIVPLLTVRFRMRRHHPSLSVQLPRPVLKRLVAAGISGACSIAVVAAVSPAVQRVPGLMTAQHLAGTPSVASKSSPSTAASDTVYSSRIVDLMVVSVGASGPSIVALGQGDECRCWMAFRSTDAGVTWQTAPAAEGTWSAPAHARVIHARDNSGQLAIGGGRSLFVDPRGAMFCSTDNGHSWRRTCQGGAAS